MPDERPVVTLPQAADVPVLAEPTGTEAVLDSPFKAEKQAVASPAANPDAKQEQQPDGKPEEAPKSEAKPYGWILSPTIDLMFACGGVLWLLYGAYMLGLRPDSSKDATLAAFMMWWVSKFGLIIFSYGHQPATLWRVYVSEPTRNSLGLLVTMWGAVAFGALACAMFIPGFVMPYVKLVLFWQIQHVLAQTYGVSLIYCYKRGYFLNDFEKRTFIWMINCNIVFFIVRMLTVPSIGSKQMYGLDIPFWGPLPMWVMYTSQAIAVATILVFAYNVVSRYVKKKQFFPVPALLAIGTGLATYYLNFMLEAAFALFAIAYYHGAQYLVVTSAYYLKERGLPEGLPTSQISKLLITGPALRYFVVLAIGGLLLSDIAPMCLGRFGISSAVVYLAVYATTNFHHYFSDAFIWKLRDSRVRKLLVA